MALCTPVGKMTTDNWVLARLKWQAGILKSESDISTISWRPAPCLFLGYKILSLFIVAKATVMLRIKKAKYLLGEWAIIMCWPTAKKWMGTSMSPERSILSFSRKKNRYCLHWAPNMCYLHCKIKSKGFK